MVLSVKRKLILIISSSIGGGAQKLLIDIVPYLSEFYQIQIICPDGYLVEKLREEGIEPYISEVNCSSLIKIKKYILNWADGDSFIVNPYLFGTSFYMTLAFGNSKECRIVSLLLNPIIRNNMHPAKKLIYKLIAKRIGEKSYSIAVGSPELSDEVMKYAHRRAFYLENRVPNVQKPQKRLYNGEGSEPLKVCFVARMAEQKRPDILVQTAKLTHDAHLNVLYYMAGVGDLKAKTEKFVLENDLQETVTFVGFVDNLYEFLLGMDVLVITSAFENTPLIILNAMNAGLPVIAGRVPGIPHLVNNGIDGIVTDEYSPNGFFEAIVKIVENPEMYREMSEQAYNKAITEFSYDRFVDQYHSVLEDG